MKTPVVDLWPPQACTQRHKICTDVCIVSELHTPVALDGPSMKLGAPVQS